MHGSMTGARSQDELRAFMEGVQPTYISAPHDQQVVWGKWPARPQLRATPRPQTQAGVPLPQLQLLQQQLQAQQAQQQQQQPQQQRQDAADQGGGDESVSEALSKDVFSTYVCRSLQRGIQHPGDIAEASGLRREATLLLFIAFSWARGALLCRDSLAELEGHGSN